jgi:hypothetical protein
MNVPPYTEILTVFQPMRRRLPKLLGRRHRSHGDGLPKPSMIREMDTANVMTEFFGWRLKHWMEHRQRGVGLECVTLAYIYYCSADNLGKQTLRMRSHRRCP